MTAIRRLSALSGALLLCVAGALPARAALTQDELSRVGLQAPAKAGLPLTLGLRDEAGRATSLRQVAGGEPLVLVFADYRCNTLCGPALTIVAARLAQTGLSPGRDYRLAVVGLDPTSTPADARAFAEARLPAGSPLRGATRLLAGSPGAITTLTRDAGYGYVYDAQERQFVHPVAAFVLTADGRVAASLSEINLTAAALRRAITTAGAGGLTELVDQVALICHGALAAIGRFDGPALAGLRVGGVATLLAMGGVGAWLIRRRRAT